MLMKWNYCMTHGPFYGILLPLLDWHCFLSLYVIETFVNKICGLLSNISIGKYFLSIAQPHHSSINISGARLLGQVINSPHIQNWCYPQNQKKMPEMTQIIICTCIDSLAINISWHNWITFVCWIIQMSKCPLHQGRGVHPSSD